MVAVEERVEVGEMVAGWKGGASLVVEAMVTVGVVGAGAWEVGAEDWEGASAGAAAEDVGEVGVGEAVG